MSDAHKATPAAALLAAPVVAVPHPDAALFRAIATYVAASDAYNLRGGRNAPDEGALLAECVKHFFGEDLAGAHDALVDVRACARVFFRLRDLQKKAA
jgi:hypothetical protein